METIVYKYGLLRPTQNADLVERQMRLAHNYRNDMTHIERARRAAVRELLAEHDEVRQIDEKLGLAKKALELALEAVAKHKGKERTRKVPPELRDAVTQARAEARALRVARFSALKAAREAVAPALAAVEEHYSIMHKSIRAASGVYHGSYLLVDDAMNLVRKMPIFTPHGEPNDPRFVPWRHEGQIGVQIPNGIPVESLVDDTRVRLEIAPVRGKSKRAVKNQYAVLWLRIGSEGPGNRTPVWARFPMILSRPLPPGAFVKRVSVKKREVGPIGTKPEWSVQFTLGVEHLHHRCGTGMVAVDLGWRSMEDGIRVGTWLGEIPRTEVHPTGVKLGFTILPSRMQSGLDKVRSLRSIRDREFDKIRAALLDWFDKQRHTPFLADEALVAQIGPESLAHWRKNLPEPHLRKCDEADLAHVDELYRRIATLQQWKSAVRLHELVRWWTDHRVAGDTVAYSIAEAWRYQDRHLWAWEAHQSKKLKRYQLQVYREAAARLAATYETLVLEDLNLTEFAETPAPESGAANDAGDLRQIAAPSVLRAALVNAFGKHRVVLVPPEFTTKNCAHCGTTNEVGAPLYFTCVNCGLAWDQDLNACHNLLAWALANGKRLEAKSPEGSRFTRARQRKEEREKSATSSA